VSDLPPPSYEQTIEAIVRCEIPRGNVRIKYEDYLQSDEVTISDLGAVTEDKLRCLKGAVHPFYILTIEDMSQRAAFYEFSEREDRPKQKAEALDWLRSQELLDRLPVFRAGQRLEDFAVAVELACGLDAGSVLMVWDENSITVRPDALSITEFEKSAKDLWCLTQMIAASNANENDVRFVIIGNGPASEEEQK
jgi:hypothetical protein